MHYTLSIFPTGRQFKLISLIFLSCIRYVFNQPGALDKETSWIARVLLDQTLHWDEDRGGSGQDFIWTIPCILHLSPIVCGPILSLVFTLEAQRRWVGSHLLPLHASSNLVVFSARPVNTQMKYKLVNTSTQDRQQHNIIRYKFHFALGLNSYCCPLANKLSWLIVRGSRFARFAQIDEFTHST